MNDMELLQAATGEQVTPEVTLRAKALGQRPTRELTAFLLNQLENKETSWRLLAVSLLGLNDDHEPSAAERAAIEERLNDESPLVRVKAAAAVAAFGKGPSEALSAAFRAEHASGPKLAMFEALLEVNGVPYHQVLEWSKRAKRGEVQMDLEDVEKIINGSAQGKN